MGSPELGVPSAPMRPTSPRLFVALTLSLSLVGAALAFTPAIAQACSCMRAPEPVEAARGADAVFSAKLVSVAEADSGTPDFPNKVFTFEVAQTLKGNLDPQVRVITAHDSAACGRDYDEAGSEWLIYARIHDDGQLRDNLCSRTMPLDQAGADLEALEASKDSLSAPPTPSEPAGADEGGDAATPVDVPLVQGEGEVTTATEDGPEPASPGKKGCAVISAEEAGLGGTLGGVGLLALFGFFGLRRRDA
ncbi:hypothetical protein PPSIR1_33491 [Plesiocystis pacifica SIR-1]|uniref:Tissue inhibitor of metalloproteinase n=2 Tax=Plesiocystis pacifica TaxID=191768 RepID=A6GE42_9BACT|nr:hypothetical protein PPSIR1_33491 [Plesiocystis pacifica SIR-1]